MTTYQRGNISVDRYFARFGSKSYAINKMNTVEIREQQPRHGAATLLVGVGAIVLLGNLAPGNQGWMVAAIFLALGAYLWIKAKAVYRLFLMTSSNKVQAYQSKDASETTALRQAVEGAMMGR